MTDTAELRTRIAEAMHSADCGCTKEQRDYDYYLDLADAVLPVVASDRKALREEVEELAVELINERTAHQALRVAVGQLADELEAEAAFRPETSYGDGIVKTKRNAARRLRSLLDDKDNPDGLR